MLRIQLYPVMDGVEVWVSGNCSDLEAPHANHTSKSYNRYLSGEDIAQRGLEGALAHELTLSLHEFSEITDRARCGG